MLSISPDTTEPTDTVFTGLIVPEASTTWVIVHRSSGVVSYVILFFIKWCAILCDYRTNNYKQLGYKLELLLDQNDGGNKFLIC